MRINGFDGYVFSIPTNFRIARWDIKFSRHCVVVLNVDGVQGCGSAPLYSTRPWAAMRLLREEFVPCLEETGFRDLNDLRDQVHQRFVLESPPVVFALDTALWDIEAKIAGKPVNQLLGTPRRNRIEIAEQVFLDDIAKTVQEVEDIVRRGTRHIKVKIGRTPATDVERVRAIREAVGSEVTLGVDINRGYTFEQALRIGKQLKDLDVAILEDPVFREDWERIPALREETGIPVMQDAGVRSLDDLRQAIEMGAVDVLNLKLTRIAGMTRALQFTQLCLEHGVGISIGCAEDLGPGMASILHFSSIFEDVYSTEGVGPARLGFDVIDETWKLQSGTLSVPAGPGLGVTFNEEKLADAAREKRFVVGDVHKPSAAFRLQCAFNKWYQRCSTLQCRLQRRFQDVWGSNSAWRL